MDNNSNTTDNLDHIKEQLQNLIQQDFPQCIQKQLINILKSSNDNGNYSVFLNSKVLLDANIGLGHLSLRNPERFLLLFGSALVDEQERIYLEIQKNSNDTKSLLSWSVKRNTHARINWLPSAHRKLNVSSIRSHDIGTFIQFSGTVVRSGQLKVLEALRVFKCGNSKCNIPIRCQAAMNEIGSIIQIPSGPCPHCKKSSSYSEQLSEKICWDYQEVRVQENVQKLEMGSIPRSITVVLLHDLVDTCKAGDDVVITGYPFNRWGSLYKDERCQLEVVIMANTIHVGNSMLQGGGGGGGGGGMNTIDHLAFMDEFQRFWTEYSQHPLQGRDVLVRSICPQLHGLYYVKLAVLLCLCGSSPSIDSNTGARTRGDSHLLLVGDPGTGKSQFLRFACKLMTRSVLTTGCGTTSAGLTCATVREGNEFMLEAGALVLADRGICCIDEFGSIREHDRATIHEAMEQQSLSIAKAGLVTQLNTRATIIAATNPKGSYDVDSDISSNTGIAPPLLSRFDLVLLLLDRPDPSWDRTVSEFVLKSHLDVKSMRLINEQQSPSLSENTTSTNTTTSNVIPSTQVLPIEKLRTYIAHVRKTFEPTLSSEAGEVLRKYYTLQRRNEHDGSGRTTLRFLESLIRISKAHARLMARQVVLLADALVTIALVELSGTNIVGGNGSEQGTTLHIDFPLDPDQYFEHVVVKDILLRLGMSPDHIKVSFNVGNNNSSSSRVNEPSVTNGNNTTTNNNNNEIGQEQEWFAGMPPGGFTHAFFPSNNDEL
jgi:DNA helicase MCM9